MKLKYDNDPSGRNQQRQRRVRVLLKGDFGALAVEEGDLERGEGREEKARGRRSGQLTDDESVKEF